MFQLDSARAFFSTPFRSLVISTDSFQLSFARSVKAWSSSRVLLESRRKMDETNRNKTKNAAVIRGFVLRKRMRGKMRNKKGTTKGATKKKKDQTQTCASTKPATGHRVSPMARFRLLTDQTDHPRKRRSIVFRQRFGRFFEIRIEANLSLPASDVGGKGRADPDVPIVPQSPPRSTRHVPPTLDLPTTPCV